MIFLQPLIQNFWQGCKNCLLRVQSNKTDVIFRTWLLIPEVFFGTWAGNFENSSEKNAKVRWNCTLPLERNSPMLKHFMSNSKVILFFSHGDKSFDRVQKIAFYVYRRKVWGKNNFLKCFIIFINVPNPNPKLFGPPDEKYSAGLSKLLSICPEKKNGDLLFVKETYNFLHFSEFEWFVSCF